MSTTTTPANDPTRTAQNTAEATPTKNTALKAIFETLVSDRKPVEETWQLIERFIYPIGGGKFFQDERSTASKNWRRREVYDDTAIMGADMLASSIHSAVTPDTSQWFDINFNDEALRKDKAAVAWLQNATAKTWLEIQSSNFDLEVGQKYLDLVSFGNGFQAQERVNGSQVRWEGTRFTAMPLKECYVELDAEGNVVRFFRLVQYTPVQIMAKFGGDAPDRVKKLATQGSQSRLDMVYAITPNPDAKQPEKITDIVPTNEMAWTAQYYMREDFEAVGKPLGYHEMPVDFTQWKRTTSSTWGYGQGHLALPSVLTLNEYRKLVLKAGEKAIDPPLKARQRGVIGNVQLSAGGVTVVRDMDDLQPLESGARFDVSFMQIDELQNMVKDLFRMNQLQLQDGPQMTATEVEVRYELMHRLLGPVLGRITNSMLNNVVERTFMALWRSGEFGELPDALTETNVGTTIEYLAPLARAQKVDKALTLQRWLTMVAEAAEVFPAMQSVPDPVGAAQYMARVMDIPTEAYRSDEEIQEVDQLKRQVEILSQRIEEAENAARQQPSQ